MSRLAPIAHPETGQMLQPVVVGKSRPFARALLTEWGRLDGTDRRHQLGWKSFNVPLDVYERIEGAARARVENWERADLAQAGRAR